METFKVGDLVYVAYPNPCCGYAEALGTYFVVAEVTTYHPLRTVGRCTTCGTVYAHGQSLREQAIEEYGHLAVCCRKVPPLTTDQQRAVELTA